MWQVACDQLEGVLRCAAQLRIRGLESELSRESSVDTGASRYSYTAGDWHSVMSQHPC